MSKSAACVMDAGNSPDQRAKAMRVRRPEGEDEKVLAKGRRFGAAMSSGSRRAKGRPWRSRAIHGRHDRRQGVAHRGLGIGDSRAGEVVGLGAVFQWGPLRLRIPVMSGIGISKSVLSRMVA